MKTLDKQINKVRSEIDLHIDIGYPTVDNDPALTEVGWQLANEFMGKENVSETELRMGAEDFGFYTQVIPGCFYRLGVMNIEKGIISVITNGGSI